MELKKILINKVKNDEQGKNVLFGSLFRTLIWFVVMRLEIGAGSLW